MTIIVSGLALLVIIAVILLAVVRAGIRRQERCGCLTCRAPGLAASLTRRLVALSARNPTPCAWHAPPAHHAKDEPLLVPGEHEPPAGR